MLKLLRPISRFLTFSPQIYNTIQPPTLVRSFTSLIPSNASVSTPSLLSNLKQVQLTNNVISRNLIKFSMNKGRRKSVKAVRLRFYRLAWGGWVRTMCGRHKKLWKKSPPRKRRLRQHVLCNGTQSYLLDKMVGPFWTKRRYYVDDPYEPYHERDYFDVTSRKPKEFIPESGSVPNC